MITPQQKTIDGIDFEVQPLPAFRAFETLPRITALFAPALAKLEEGAGMKALAAVAETNPKELLALTKILLEGSTVVHDGRKQALLPVFDTVMVGKMLTTFKLAAFAVEVNYADFFGELKKRLAGRVALPPLS